ncbi:hypothetical protein CDAR_596441 [Caerostris darwini]|uniref:Uncharacterized protein n=1 Tax=Caerostris darwini TaxID=1538125 RepID=A0AAV4UT11_9ARAC|nr:hypothetical protein CDAR_596441 [Caerostris darwini]
MSKRVVSSPETISATSFGVSFNKHTKEMIGQTRSKSCQSRRPFNVWNEANMIPQIINTRLESKPGNFYFDPNFRNQNINVTDKFSRRTENINVYEDRINNGIDSIRIAETGIRYQTDGKENNESETNSNLTSVTSKYVSEPRNVCSYENSEKSVNSRHMYIRTENASTTEDEDSNDTNFKTVAGVKIRDHNNVKANNEGKVNQNLTNFNTKLESKPRNFHSYQNSANKIMNAKDIYSKTIENGTTTEDQEKNDTGFKIVAGIRIRNQTDIKANNERGLNQSLIDLATILESKPRDFYSYQNSENENVNSRRTQNGNITEDHKNNDHDYKIVAGVRIRNEADITAYNEKKRNQSLINLTTIRESKLRDFCSYQNSENENVNGNTYSRRTQNGNITEDHKNNDHDFKIVAGIRIRNEADITAYNEKKRNQSLINLTTIRESKLGDFYSYQNSEIENVNSRHTYSRTTQIENIIEDHKNNEDDIKIVAGVRIRNEADIKAYNERERNQSLINLTTIHESKQRDLYSYQNSENKNVNDRHIYSRRTQNENITEDHNNNDHDFKTLAGIRIRNQTNVKGNNEEEENFTMLSTRRKSKPRNYHPYQNFKNRSVTAGDAFSRNIENLSINKDLQNNCTDSKMVAGTRIRNLPVEENVKVKDDPHFADSNTSCESTVNDFCCPYSEKSDSNSWDLYSRKIENGSVTQDKNLDASMKTVAGIRIRNQTAVKENGERKDGRQMTILNRLKERNRSAGKQQFSLAKLESELKMIRSNILKNFVKKQVYQPSDRKQKTPSNRVVSDSSASVDDEQLNTISKPDTLKNSIRIPESNISHNEGNNSISSLNNSQDCAIPQNPSSMSASGGHVSVALSENGKSVSNRSESNATETNLKTSSESVSTIHTSCDSCLVTSSSTDTDEDEDEDEDEDQEACLDESFPQSVPPDTRQSVTIDYDEDVPSSSAGDDSESAMESILIRTASMNFNDKDGVESSTKERVFHQMKPFENGCLYWLKHRNARKEDVMKCRKNKSDGAYKNTRQQNIINRISNYDDLIKALISTRALNIPNNQSQDLTSNSTNNDIQIRPISLRQRNNHLRNGDNTTKNQKKQLPDDVELEKLSTNQVLAQIGLSVLARERPIEMLMSSPKKGYTEAYRKILTLCGYGN